MKRTLAMIVAVAVMVPVLSEAKDLVWDRNTEPDMQDYQVWGCQTANCVVIKTQANLLATVPQVPVGSIPKWTLPAAMTYGQLAISARDTSLNESGLSVSVPFDLVPPLVPGNPRLQ